MKLSCLKSVGWCVFFTMFLLVFMGVGKASAMMKKSHEFGNVIMDQSTKAKGQSPVVFRHWLHRAKHSCRLCHVDIEFGMMAGSTGIMEEDNTDGRYCGTCHNGKEAFSVSECSKCHAKDSRALKEKDHQAKRAFFKFKKGMPRSTYGNKIDWNKAEETGLIKAKDFIDGVSFPEKGIGNIAKDVLRTPKLPGLPGIIFSHEKHIAWTGCGMCHPEPFALETGKTKMTMREISDGKYCGICHGSVAFPLNDCSKCHSSPVK